MREMGNFSFIQNFLAILVLVPLQFLACSASSTRPTSKANTEYIRASCTATIYQRLCYTSLSIYADQIKTNPKTLALAALKINLSAAKSTSMAIKNLSESHGLKRREVAAILDCVEEASDSVFELQRSIDEMGHITRSDFGLQMSDVQTWVSAALTDEDTCMDGFAGHAMDGNVKVIVRRHIVKVAHLTSNALALVNRYASSVKIDYP